MFKTFKKEILSNKQPLRKVLIDISIILFIVTMPFSIKLNSLSIILVIVCWLSKENIILAFQNLRSRRLLQLFTFFYALYFVGLLLSENAQSATEDIVLKISLFLLPIIFSTLHLSEKKVQYYLSNFIIACTFAALASLTLLLHKIFILGNYRSKDQFLGIDWVWFSYFLPKQINFHSPYFSMYVVMSIFILIYFLKTQSDKRLRILNVVALLFLTLFAFLLSSRTALASGIIIFISGVLFTLIKEKKIVLAFTAIVVTVLSLAGIYQSTPYLKRKIEDNSGIVQRQKLWSASTKLVAANLLLGVGTGDVKDKLVEEYKRLHYTEEEVSRMDPHNQYLQLLVALGVLGLLSYLLCLYYLTFISYKKEIYLLLAFTFLFALCGLTESNLGAQKGVILFAFFSALLGNFSYSKAELGEQSM